MPRAISFTACCASGRCPATWRSRHSSVQTRQHCRRMFLSDLIFLCQLETRCADRITLLHVHVFEALIKVPTDVMSPFTHFVRSTTFFTRNFCFNFLRHVSNKSITAREKFIVNVQVLKKVSGVHVKRFVDSAGFESEAFAASATASFQNRGEPRYPYKALSTL